MSRCATSRPEAMAETKRLCEAERLPQGLRVTTHVADVSIEDQLQRFRDELIEQQATDKIHLLFNNAGIGGGGSLFTNTREQWERTFNICWGGVYLGVRTFLPLLLKADEGHIVNTSQRQRLLGLGRPGRVAHRLQRRQIRGEGLYRSADQRSPAQRAAHQMLGRDARPYRHLDRVQFAQDPERRRSEQLSPNEILADAAAPEGHGHRHRADVGRRYPEDRARPCAHVPRRGADHGGAAAKIILDGVKADRWRISSATTPAARRAGAADRRTRPIRRSSTRALRRRSAGGSAEAIGSDGTEPTGLIVYVACDQFLNANRLP